MIRHVLALVVLLLLPAPSLWAATYFVSKNGSDANSCATAQSTTQSNQRLTIQSALGCLAPGDTLQIHGGTYSEQLFIDQLTCDGHL